MVDWEWYKDTNTFRIFFHLLISANHEDKKWRGIIIKRGQVITSRKSLENRLNISQMKIRRVLANLQTTSELTIQPTNKYSLITIVKYEDYQQHGKKTTSQTTSQTTTTKEDKKFKKERDFSEEKSFPLKTNSKKDMLNYNENKHTDEYEATIDAESGELRSSKKVSKSPMTKKIEDIFIQMCIDKVKSAPLKSLAGRKRIVETLKVLTPEQTVDLLESWFSSGKEPKDLVQITQALSNYQINSFKAERRL